MTIALTGQLILGTDKRNPLFTVYAEEEQEKERLHVYYGLELLEKVSADRGDANFRMLVGRLYNAGLKRRVLAETFQVDPKTMRKWGRALLCADAQQMVQELGGVRARRKVTPEIQAYARTRWLALSHGPTAPGDSSRVPGEALPTDAAATGEVLEGRSGRKPGRARRLGGFSSSGP
jgi:uncharacterized protein with von Willebrand factor type A (vWA) domain